MKKYEIMFIVVSTLGEEELESTVQNFKDIITKNEGIITNFEKMGKRELAYEIKKHKSGYYYLLNIEAKDEAINEFDRLARINKNIIRYLIIKVD